MIAKSEWVLCPVCGGKTRDRLREDTVLINYPLYCPKCKQETLINAKELSLKSQTHRRRADGLVGYPTAHRLCL